MADLNKLLKIVIEKKATDLHLAVNLPPMIRIDGDLIEIKQHPKLGQFEIEQMIFGIVNERQKNEFLETGELDFGYTLQDICRFRINVFRERGNIGAALRFIPIKIPTMEEIGLSKVIEKVLDHPTGLILVTGPTGSGKSTTLASMINYLNNKVSKHVVTIEDPIEYTFSKIRCKFSQREVKTDTNSFSSALKHVLREDPDIILVGEMRDTETIMATITCAETGHLVFSTLHTIDSTQTVDRIIDSFPGYQQNQVRFQLSMLLQAIISQRLMKRVPGGLIAAREILLVNDAVRNLIREQKTQQIYSILQTGAKEGMSTLDMAILSFYKAGIITRDVAIYNVKNREEFMRKISGGTGTN